ncbi:hypothetical protein [Bacillus cereus]|uniref:hypothetical protein n=1 Tax=Bacillus cereus TaxID=1396 RepID=UPI0015953923|nr:hypothetical protein [Bacillus cereus]
MIIRAMFYGAIIGFILAIVYFISEGTFDLNTLIGMPLFGAIFAIPVRKWIFRTFWV